METITVLSPHRDDSSFSVGLALCQWSAASLPLQVINFFTQSAYAPHSPAATIEEVSAIRDQEDRRALAYIHPSIEVIALDLLDAPLRLDLPFSQITQPQSSEKISAHELHGLSQSIRQHCTNSLVIAPLALGNHVDHVAVQRAALDSLLPEQLAFYEDLPYATWTSPADLQARLESIQNTTGMRLQELMVQTPTAMEQKRRIASFYQSQITAEEADAIAQFTRTHENGERLWVPAASERWKAIRLPATSTRQTAMPHPPRQQPD